MKRPQVCSSGTDVVFYVGMQVTVRELRGNGDSGVGTIIDVHDNDDSYEVELLLDKRKLKRVSRERLRPGNHAGELLIKAPTKYKLKVDALFDARDDNNWEEFTRRVAVLHLDDLVDKKSATQVEYVLQKLEATPPPPVQVMFFQGAIPLQEKDELFERFLKLLERADGSTCMPTAMAKRSHGNLSRNEHTKWRTQGSNWLGRRVEVPLVDTGAEDKIEMTVSGVIDGWLPAAESKRRLGEEHWQPLSQLFRVRYDDADVALDAKLGDLDEHQVKAFAVDATVGRVSSRGDSAKRPTRIWSVNLGELNLVPRQLGKLRDALANSGVTHMFYECNNLFSMAPCEPKDCCSPTAADACAKVIASGSSNFWKDLFREILRLNRQKHDLYLFRDPSDATQNAVIHRCVKNWFNPTGHAANKAWLGKTREGRIQSSEERQAALEFQRHDERRIEPGDRVVFREPEFSSTEHRGQMLMHGKVALDRGGQVGLGKHTFAAADYGTTWKWDNEPRVGDVIKYQFSRFESGSANTLVQITALDRCPGWYAARMLGNAQMMRVLCAPQDQSPETMKQPFWTLVYPSGSTGSEAFRQTQKTVVTRRFACADPGRIDGKKVPPAPPAIGSFVDLLTTKDKSKKYIQVRVLRHGVSDDASLVDYFLTASCRQANTLQPPSTTKESCNTDDSDAATRKKCKKSATKHSRRSQVSLPRVGDRITLSSRPGEQFYVKVVSETKPTPEELMQSIGWRRVRRKTQQYEATTSTVYTRALQAATKFKVKLQRPARPDPYFRIKSVVSAAEEWVQLYNRYDCEPCQCAGDSNITQRVPRHKFEYVARANPCEDPEDEDAHEPAGKRLRLQSRIVDQNCGNKAFGSVSHLGRQDGASVLETCLPNENNQRRNDACAKHGDGIAPNDIKRRQIQRDMNSDTAEKGIDSMQQQCEKAIVNNRPRRECKKPCALGEESTSEYSRALRKKQDWCEVETNDGEYFKAKLGRQEFRVGKWRPSVAEDFREPFVLSFEEWEHAAIRSADGEKRLARKYTGIVFRDVECNSYDETFKVLSIIQSATVKPKGVYWLVLSARINDKTGELIPGKNCQPYGIESLIRDGLVARAPAELQIRPVVLSVP